MFRTTGFRIPPAVGEVIGIGLMVIGVTSGVASIVIMGAVIVAAATVRFLFWR
jgi:hypothetical protein